MHYDVAERFDHASVLYYRVDLLIHVWFGPLKQVQEYWKNVWIKIIAKYSKKDYYPR